VLNLIVAGLAVVLVALIVTLTEKTNVGFVGVALVTIMNFNVSLTNLIKYWTMLVTSMGAIARIKCFVKDVEAESEPAAPAQLDPCWPQQGLVEISNLTVSYGYVIPYRRCLRTTPNAHYQQGAPIDLTQRLTSHPTRREDRDLRELREVRIQRVCAVDTRD
jgi:ABC-type multidrug transport system fused ATPase/permease subunit